MKKIEYRKGSEWRKWDLHVHTHNSYDWDNKCKVANSDIVDTAIKSGISAIAITDHHSVKSIDEIKKYGQDKGLFVVPGVELSTDKGNKHIHLIGLFDPMLTAKTIYDKLLCPLGLSEDDIEKSGNEKIYCDFEDACEKIHELGGLAFLHAGTKSNGIEQLDSDIKSLLKSNMASKVDIFEVNSKKNATDYTNIVFPILGRFIPCIITSDSTDRSKLTYTGGHSTEVIGKASTWIKADLSFNGLKQILSEPVDRVCLDEKPPKLVDLNNNQTKYINSINIIPTSPHSPAWFNNSIPLNYGLIAIIGRKGNGKSALADTVALCGKSHVPVGSYSFLNPTKFKKNKTIAKKYKGSIKWFDNEETSMNLIDTVDITTEPERVKYLPQSFVEKICNEDGVSPLFQNEIDKVIFSYVPYAKRLDTISLSELINKRTESIEELISRIRSDINIENYNIATLEEKKTSRYKEKIEKELEEKNNEYKSIKNPVVIKKPKGKLPKAQQDRLEKIEDRITNLDGEISEAKNEQIAVNKELDFIERLCGKLSSLEEDKTKIFDSFSDESKKYGFDLSKIIEMSIKKETINSRKEILNKKQISLETKLDEDGKDPKNNFYAEKRELESSKEKITKLLDTSNRIYQQYLSQKKEIEKQREALTGISGDKSLKTIISLQEELSYLSSGLDTDLEKMCEEREGLVKQLYGAISSKITLYKEIYKPLIDFITKEKDEQIKSGNILTFDAGVVFNKSVFEDSFLEFINQGKDGSFQSKDGGVKQLKEILIKYSFQKQEDAIRLINEIIHSLRFDITKNPEEPNEIKKQLNQKYTVTDIYNFLYGLEYIDVHFKILFNEKDLNENEFSPGEKGALLLIFYLLIDKDKIPLIMDQPEENLDNESVYSLLVPYIRKAKKKRQIIIVTHNPNLAVVCDAEQIIHATMNKKKNEIRYESGSIENPNINKKIVDILEGTMPAFTKRDEKYLKN